MYGAWYFRIVRNGRAKEFEVEFTSVVATRGYLFSFSTKNSSVRRERGPCIASRVLRLLTKPIYQAESARGGGMYDAARPLTCWAITLFACGGLTSCHAEWDTLATENEQRTYNGTGECTSQCCRSAGQLGEAVIVWAVW